MIFRFQRSAFALAVLVSLCASTSNALAQTFNIDFGTSTKTLPYSEDGFTVTSLSGGGIISGSDGDAELVGGTNTIPIRWQVTGSQPFTLNSLDVENVTRSWRIEASGAQTVNFTAVGTIDFTGVPGWAGITSFQIVHDPAQANGSADIDNIVVSIPEPGSALLGAIASTAALFVRRRRGASLERGAGPEERLQK